MRNLISGNPGVNDPSQYDLVYVNWRNGTDWLQRNELALEAVIRWVNANKQPLGGVMQPNVVLGSSMGGVIARMALGRMDRGGGQNGAGGFAAHQTNLYVSLDAPHQGANVPMGYQAAARHATRMYVSTGGLAVAVEIIQLLRNGPSPLLNLLLADQPASRQMLNNRIDINYNQTNATNQQFLQELRTQWAYPVNIRNIAISNGSECAIDQEFATGSSLLYHYRSTKTRFIGDLIFMVAGVGLQALNVSPLITIPLILPGSSKFELTIDIKSIANGGGNAVYYGNIKLTKKILWLVPVSVNIANKTYNAPTGILPFDTYPGGFYTLTLANQPGSVSQDWMFSYNNSFFIQRRFSFIPTTSSLDIGQGNTALTNANYVARYIGATPPVAPFNTPFANFATAFNQDGSQWIFDNSNFRRLNNEPHEGLFIRNANFLANEMNGINNVRTNCNAFCANGAITGNTNICNPQTLIAPFGNGVTYIWSVNSPIVILAPNGNTVGVSRNGPSNGQAIVSVEISGACGNTTLTIPITVGTQLSDINVRYTRNANNSQNIDFGQNPSATVFTQTGNFSVTAFTALAGTNTFNWVVMGPPPGSGYGWSNFTKSGSNCSFTLTGTNAPTIPLQVTLTNTQNGCTSDNLKGVVFVASIPGGTMGNIVVSPNPVTDNINVTFTEPLDSSAARRTNTKPATAFRSLPSKGKTIVSLFDFNSTVMVRQWTKNEVNSKRYNFNIAGLRKGLYVLQVDRDDETITTKIIVD